jgi:hypothetical protein
MNLCNDGVGIQMVILMPIRVMFTFHGHPIRCSRAMTTSYRTHAFGNFTLNFTWNLIWQIYRRRRCVTRIFDKKIICTFSLGFCKVINGICHWRSNFIFSFCFTLELFFIQKVDKFPTDKHNKSISKLHISTHILL